MPTKLHSEPCTDRRPLIDIYDLEKLKGWGRFLKQVPAEELALAHPAALEEINGKLENIAYGYFDEDRQMLCSAAVCAAIFIGTCVTLGPPLAAIFLIPQAMLIGFALDVGTKAYQYFGPQNKTVKAALKLQEHVRPEKTR